VVQIRAAAGFGAVRILQLNGCVLEINQPPSRAFCRKVLGKTATHINPRIWGSEVRILPVAPMYSLIQLQECLEIRRGNARGNNSPKSAVRSAPRTARRPTGSREDLYLDARPALRSFEPAADEDQLSLIHATGEILRLVAPAGSGETQTIINRVLHAAKNGTKPERILYLTFDNAAGKALRDKFSEQLASLGGAKNDFRITTLNAFGWRANQRSSQALAQFRAV
jgi:hypothetical protein